MLTEVQKESVREIAEEISYSYVSTLCDAMNAAQEVAMIADIASYSPVRNKTTRLQAIGNENVDYDPARTLERLRIRVRLRLGLSAHSTASAGTDPNAIQCLTISCGPSWMGSCTDEYANP